MGFAKQRRVDNSRTHPLYIGHRLAYDAWRAAFDAHQVAGYESDLATAKAYQRVLELGLASNAAYIKLLESGVPAIEYVCV